MGSLKDDVQIKFMYNRRIILEAKIYLYFEFGYIKRSDMKDLHNILPLLFGQL